MLESRLPTLAIASISLMDDPQFFE